MSDGDPSWSNEDTCILVLIVFAIVCMIVGFGYIIGLWGTHCP